MQEVEQRIAAELLDGDERHYIICTIHSFCLTQVLRPFAWLVPGFAGTMRVLTQDRPEFQAIARNAAEQVNFFNLVARDFEAFASLSLDANGRLIGLALTNEAVRRATPHFWRRCTELEFIDFRNIIYKAYCLIRDNRMVAQSVASRFSSFLVDEFQDTTELQIEILKLIHAQGRSRIFAVGDPAQSIFGFTGARPELMEPFARDVRARTDLHLTGNFRSSPPIVRHAELLIPRDPEMQSVGRYRNFHVVPSLVQTSGTLRRSPSTSCHCSPTPVFPLAKPPSSRGVGAALSALAPAPRVRHPGGWPGRTTVSAFALVRSLAEQLCGYLVDPAAHSTRQLERALFHAVQDATARVCLEIFSFTGRVTLVKLLREAERLAQRGGAVQWLDAMSQVTGVILHDDGLIDDVHAGLFYASVQEMKADMRGQGVDLDNLTIEDLGLFASPSRALRLSTIHNAKGREFGAIALINLREGRFPHYRADDMNAERRLFYVAITRAERVLMYIAEPDQWGNAPSRFLGRDGVGLV